MEFKNGFKAIKLRGRPLFIDTLSKSWPSDQRHFRRSGLRHVISQQYAAWPHGLNNNTVWPGWNSNTVWLKIILCNACTAREIFGPLIDSTVHVHMYGTVYVNSVIFPFMLLLRFSTILSSKVMSVLPSDLSFIMK